MTQDLSYKTLFAVYLPSLLFALVALYFISHFHVSALSRDMWHMYAPYFDKGWWQAAITAMSNHRHLLLFLFLHLDMIWFEGQNHLITALGAIFNCTIIFLLWRTLWKDAAFSPWQRALLGTFFITQFFWLIHIAQLGWGFMSFNYYLAILLFLFSIFCAYHFLIWKKSIYWLYSSLLAGVLCTFTFGIGILIWPSLWILCFIWRQPLRILVLYFLACVACLVLFMLLPGGQGISSTIIFRPLNSILFTLQLPSGPVYYLLKGWRLFDAETNKNIASFIGYSASFIGLFYITEQLFKRRPMSLFISLAFALMLLGFGSAALITFTRGQFFLDVWVDRYQIWATFYWVGLISFSFYRLPDTDLFQKIKKFILCVCFALPALYFPSQLDLGSRLAEYKNRVNIALLSYQLYIPVRSDAHDALHWNWQHNLPYLFYVMDFLRQEEKNIFSMGEDKLLGQNMMAVSSTANSKKLLAENIQHTAISFGDLLNAREFTYQDNEGALDQQWPTPSAKNESTIATRWNMKIPDSIHWDFGLITDQQDNIIGIAKPISHPAFPRGNFKYTGRKYNLYGLSKDKSAEAEKIFLVSRYSEARNEVLFEIDLNTDKK